MSALLPLLTGWMRTGRLTFARRPFRSVCLERDVLVEGGDVRGRMEVNVRDWNKKEGDVHVGFGKVRIVGFEGLPPSLVVPPGSSVTELWCRS